MEGSVFTVSGSVRSELMEGSVFTVSRFSSFRVDGRQCIYRKPVQFAQS